jgi:hypothetical protein
MDHIKFLPSYRFIIAPITRDRVSCRKLSLSFALAQPSLHAIPPLTLLVAPGLKGFSGRALPAQPPRLPGPPRAPPRPTAADPARPPAYGPEPSAIRRPSGLPSQRSQRSPGYAERRRTGVASPSGLAAVPYGSLPTAVSQDWAIRRHCTTRPAYQCLPALQHAHLDPLPTTQHGAL